MLGMSSPDFDNQTLAVLRGRMVRYLMRSREVSPSLCLVPLFPGLAEFSSVLLDQREDTEWCVPPPITVTQFSVFSSEQKLFQHLLGVKAHFCKPGGKKMSTILLEGPS